MKPLLGIGFWCCVAPACLLATRMLAAAEPSWPQFRGPEANPVSGEARLADQWGKTENIEWAVEIPGRGWSSPIVWGDSDLCYDGGNRGGFEAASDRHGVQQRVYRRTGEERPYRGADPRKGDRAGYRIAEGSGSALLPLLPKPEDREGGMEEGIPFGTPAGRTAPEKQLRLGNTGDRWPLGVCLCRQPGSVCV